MCQPFSSATKSRFHTVQLAHLAVIVLLFQSFGYAQTGARTVTRSLDQLTSEAHVIVRGHVVSTKLEPHPQLRNLMTVVVSIDVTKTYKGQPSRSLVFRQFVWDLQPDHAAAQYRKGDDVILFLGPVSEYGLTSPVGLGQGLFRVSVDQKGQTMALNGQGNWGLLRGLAERAKAAGVPLSARALLIARQSKGPIRVKDLEEMIRAFVEQR